VFESFRDAWRQAVDNFWQELHAGEGGAGAGSRAMLAQVARARSEVARLDQQIAECQQGRDTEQAEAEVCARRERLARRIGDEETAAIAADFRVRHEERATVLASKLEALVAERRIRGRDLGEMEQALAAVVAAAEPDGIGDLDRHPREGEFRDLERAARERSAAERLEELKRRDQG
jgi:hypothetical protein